MHRVKTLLFIFLLSAVRGNDDFITKYDKYSHVCKKMGYQDKQCAGRELIAFHARILTHLRNLNNMDAVIFSDVTLNTGNAYNATTGEFTAPVKGHYSFTWTITTNGGTLFSTQLVFNGKPVSYNYVNGKHGVNHETGSSTVVLKMESNDVVSIRAYDQGELAFKMWSSFTGFKL